MKRVFFVLFCACTTRAPRAVELAAPLASTPVVTAHDELVLPRGATRMDVAVDAPWAADFTPSKTFAIYDVPDARRVVLTWRVGTDHVVKRVGDSDDDTDYPANHVAKVDLVVQARNETRVISFDELSGSVEPRTLSWCARNGYRREGVESFTPDHPAFASTFAIGLVQGDDQMAIVRDGRTLHVLHRVTNDGFCDEAKQGPLEVCKDFQWERAADIRVGAGAELYDDVEVEGKTFDCGIEVWGERLIK